MLQQKGVLNVEVENNQLIRIVCYFMWFAVFTNILHYIPDYSSSLSMIMFSLDNVYELQSVLTVFCENVHSSLLLWINSNSKYVVTQETADAGIEQKKKNNCLRNSVVQAVSVEGNGQIMFWVRSLQSNAVWCAEFLPQFNYFAKSRWCKLPSSFKFLFTNWLATKEQCNQK